MAVTQEQSAPYAPASAILGLIERHRNRGLPTPITAETLARAGISESLIGRTLQAMQVLDLIDTEGKPTETFEVIRLSSESEYPGRLREWVTAAYADALTFVDPQTATEGNIHDAFRSYKPTGQRDRMVTLFSGLCLAAGMMPARDKAATKNSSGSPQKPRASPKPPPPKPVDVTPQTQDGDGGSRKPLGTGGNVPVPIQSLFENLPAEGQTWTLERRDKFMNAVGVLVDFYFPPQG